MSIESQIRLLRNELPSTVKLVAVSKFKPNEEIMMAYNAGQRCFGENRPQEFASKAQSLPNDIEWHFIGHLQTNKLKLVLPYASLIHSVDSIKLLSEINRLAGTMGKSVDILLEAHIATEETKQGFSAQEILSLRFEEYANVRFRGVMGMATFTDDKDLVRREFQHLREIFDKVKALSDPSLTSFDQISMGMSQDYKIAIEEGATLVRIGSNIFGPRQ